MPDLAERLRTARVARQLSQNDVARLLAVSPRTVSRWERGDTVPRQRMRRRLGRLYGLTAADLEAP